MHISILSAETFIPAANETLQVTAKHFSVFGLETVTQLDTNSLAV